jgi:uncharacterized membrane protein YhhN
VSVALLLIAEARALRPGVWLFKPLASLGFVALGGLDGSGSVDALRLGLVACAVGDVLLIPAGSSRWFLAGIASFGLGHLAYAVAFGAHAQSLVPALCALGGMALVVAFTLRWLSPHLPREMQLPVRVYMAVIACMVASAVGASAATGDPRAAVGAVAFATSDLSVARDRFVQPGFRNLVWGLPLYYAAQLLIAWTHLS